jgi:hypothetical protein
LFSIIIYFFNIFQYYWNQYFFSIILLKKINNEAVSIRIETTSGLKKFNPWTLRAVAGLEGELPAFLRLRTLPESWNWYELIAWKANRTTITRGPGALDYSKFNKNTTIYRVISTRHGLNDKINVAKGGSYTILLGIPIFDASLERPKRNTDSGPLPQWSHTKAAQQICFWLIYSL